MHNEDLVTLEIGDASIVIDVDGVHVELRGEDAKDCKRIVARQLLTAIASLPERKEMTRQREQMVADQRNYARGQAEKGYDIQRGALAGLESDASNLARAVNRSRY